jgi:hypothetical protein
VWTSVFKWDGVVRLTRDNAIMADTFYSSNTGLQTMLVVMHWIIYMYTFTLCLFRDSNGLFLAHLLWWPPFHEIEWGTGYGILFYFDKLNSKYHAW